MRFVLSLIFLFSSTLLLAAEWEFEGNNRTQTSYLKHLVQTCEQDTETPLDQCLMNTELFSQVKIEGKKITIAERWTMIPVPRFETGSAGDAYGIYLLERNFLGLGKFAMFGGTFGSQGNNFLFFYKDRDLFHTDWTSNIIVNLATTEFEAYDGKVVQAGFEERQNYYRAGIGRKFLTNFEAGLSFSFMDSAFSKLDGRSAPKSAHVWMSEASLQYKKSNFKFYFNEGVEARFSIVPDLYRSDRDDLVTRGAAKIKYQRNIWQQHVLQLAWLAGYNSNSTDKSVDKFGLRGMPSNGLWADKISALSLDYQIPIKETNYGTWTVAPFFDYGVYDSNYTRGNDYNAYGVGGYLYLKEVALPGMGLIAGYNHRFLKEFVSFSVGFKQ